jgi:MinD-like ATPase involved in chromosome partitioning or flagellar assembly
VPPAGESTGGFPVAGGAPTPHTAPESAPQHPAFDPDATQIIGKAEYAQIMREVNALQAGPGAGRPEVITPASFSDGFAPQFDWRQQPMGPWPGTPPPVHPEALMRRAQPAGPVGQEGLAEWLRAGDLVTPRKVPPTRGWRHWLYLAAFRKINLGGSRDELYERELIAQVAANLRGTYTVAVLGGKGGSGKTVITTCLASTVRSHRSDPVVAIDADPAEGANLADRIDPKAGTVRAILSDGHLNRYTDMRSLTGQNSSGLDVVASPQHGGASTTAIAPDEFHDAHAQLATFYNVLLVDSGQQLGHEVMPEVLRSANAIVLVASADTGGSAGADTNVKWLESKGYHELLSRMVVVINHHRPAASRKDRKATAQLVQATGDHFRRRVGEKRVFVLPFDEHLATSAVVNIVELNKTTRRRLLEISAALAQGFSTTSDTK